MNYIPVIAPVVAGWRDSETAGFNYGTGRLQSINEVINVLTVPMADGP